MEFEDGQNLAEEIEPDAVGSSSSAVWSAFEFSPRVRGETFHGLKRAGEHVPYGIKGCVPSSILDSVVLSSGFHKGNIEAAQIHVGSEDGVISAAANKASLEAVGGDDAPKGILGFLVETSDLGVGAAEKSGAAAGTSTFKVQKSVGEERQRVLGEGFGTVQPILLAVVEKGHDSFPGLVALGGEVGDQLQNGDDANAIIGCTKAGGNAVVMSIHKHAANTGVLDVVGHIIGTADVDHDIGALEVDAGVGAGKGDIGDHVVVDDDGGALGGVEALGGVFDAIPFQDLLDADQEPIADVVVPTRVVGVEAAGQILQISPRLGQVDALDGDVVLRGGRDDMVDDEQRGDDGQIDGRDEESHGVRGEGERVPKTASHRRSSTLEGAVQAAHAAAFDGSEIAVWLSWETRVRLVEAVLIRRAGGRGVR